MPPPWLMVKFAAEMVMLPSPGASFSLPVNVRSPNVRVGLSERSAASVPPLNVTDCRTHAPLELQLAPTLHVPQEPPHPSEPHCRPLQFTVQAPTHEPLELHVAPPPHVPQEPPHPSEPHCR